MAKHDDPTKQDGSPRTTNRGRRSLLTPELEKQILDLVGAGNYYDDACEAAGFSHKTLYRWLEFAERPNAPAKYRELRDKLQRARAQGRTVHVTFLRLHAEKDWKASAFFLERSDPARWGRRDVVQHEGSLEHGVKPGVEGMVGNLIATEKGRKAVTDLLAVVAERGVSPPQPGVDGAHVDAGPVVPSEAPQDPQPPAA